MDIPGDPAAFADLDLDLHDEVVRIIAQSMMDAVREPAKAFENDDRVSPEMFLSAFVHAHLLGVACMIATEMPKIDDVTLLNWMSRCVAQAINTVTAQTAATAS